METLTYSEADIAADKINQYCAANNQVNAIATAAPGYTESPGQATYIYKVNRAIPPGANGTIVCRLKVLQNLQNKICVLLSGGNCPSPQRFTQSQVETYVK